MMRRWAPLLLVLAAYGGMGGTPAAGAGSDAGPIAFYADLGNQVGGQTPLTQPPSTLLLAEDGSVALVHLRWSGWGTNLARATGEWSASSCDPNCAAGKRTTAPATLTLSNPGLVGGHRVYRCFQVSPPHPQRDMADQGCLGPQGDAAFYSPGPAR